MKEKNKSNAKVVIWISFSILMFISIMFFHSLTNKIEEKEDYLTEKKNVLLAKTPYLQDDGSFLVKDGLLQKKTSDVGKYFYFSLKCIDCKYYQTELKEKHKSISYKTFDNQEMKTSAELFDETLDGSFNKEQKVSYLFNIKVESNIEMVYSYLIHLSNNEPEKFESFLQEYFKLKEHSAEDLFEISEKVGIDSKTIVSFQDRREDLRLLSYFFLDTQDKFEEMTTMSRFEK